MSFIDRQKSRQSALTLSILPIALILSLRASGMQHRGIDPTGPSDSITAPGSENEPIKPELCWVTNLVQANWGYSGFYYLPWYQTSTTQGSTLSVFQPETVKAALSGMSFPATIEEAISAAPQNIQHVSIQWSEVDRASASFYTYSSGAVSASYQSTRSWLHIASKPEDQEFNFLKLKKHDVSGTINFLEFPETTLTTLHVPKGQSYSESVDLITSTSASAGTTNFSDVGLYYLEKAPDILPVNSGFNEGRIDPTTGYAIPDCDDPDLELEAVREHLDNAYHVGDKVTRSLHKGWFGLSPNYLKYSNDFWQDATVTISKLDKTDEDTGQSESGQVRFYAKWGEGPGQYCAIVPYDFDTLAAVNLLTGGIHKAPGKSVYGPASDIPSYGTTFYMEGVHAGKITLEWRYQKGTVDVKHQQTFEVCTHKTATEWKNQLAYKIRLETSNDPSGIIDVRNINLPSESYRTRMERISEYYDYYQDCFLTPLRDKPLQPQALGWAGLARLAANQNIGGLSDAEYGRGIANGAYTLTNLNPAETLLAYGLGQWVATEVADLQQLLFTGAFDIFKSIGWQMHAYRSSGYRAIQWTANETNDREAVALSISWRNLRYGVLDHDKAILDSVALDIAKREQNVIIEPTWTKISALPSGGAVDLIFNYKAKNPCAPMGRDFHDLFPSANLSDTDSRWSWVNPDTPDGIIDTWNKLPEATRASLVGKTSKVDATRFCVLSPVLVWDDEDAK